MQKNKVIFNIFNILLSVLALYIANYIVVSDFDDNQFYNLAYTSIANLPLQEAYILFTQSIGGGAEPVFFLLNYIFSSVVYEEIGFNILILCINIPFLICIHFTLKKYYEKNYQLLYAVLLISSNYIYPLLSDVHRLKFAFLFFMAFLFSKKFKSIFLLLSFFTHFQMLAYLAYRITELVSFKIKALKKTTYKDILKGIALFVGIVVIGIAFFDSFVSYIYTPLDNKIRFYLESTDSFFNLFWYGGLFSIYFTYLLLFKIKDGVRFVLPIFLPLFSISVVLNLYRLNLIWLGLVYIVEINRLLTGKKYAILIVCPLFFYSFYGLVRFILRGYGVL
jgi:hypothetical protein